VRERQRLENDAPRIEQREEVHRRAVATS
jgi:hypothetical protein